MANLKRFQNQLCIRRCIYYFTIFVNLYFTISDVLFYFRIEHVIDNGWCPFLCGLGYLACNHLLHKTCNHADKICVCFTFLM